MFKKVISFICLVSMLVCALPAVSSAGGYNNQIIVGTNKDTPALSPAMTLTRAQCARMIFKYTCIDYEAGSWGGPEIKSTEK